MTLPENLTDNFQQLVEKHGLGNLKKAAEDLSLSYRQGERNGGALIKGEISAAAYAISRMPATYGAVYTALKYINQIIDLERMNTLIDVGAGTGAASFAVREFADIVGNTLIERDRDMLNLGKSFLEGDWIQTDASGLQSKRADMVISSYMLNELSENQRLPQVERLWQSAEKLLVIVENGTPEGYKIIKEIRAWAKDKGISVVAPCPNIASCPIPEGDWCHFTARISRSKIHKLLKGGDAPYEDEKFTYIALCRESVKPVTARVLRHPKIESGKITLTLCTGEGITTAIKTKKDKAAFKTARKSSAGDSFQL